MCLRNTKNPVDRNNKGNGLHKKESVGSKEVEKRVYCCGRVWMDE